MSRLDYYSPIVCVKVMWLLGYYYRVLSVILPKRLVVMDANDRRQVRGSSIQAWPSWA